MSNDTEVNSTTSMSSMKWAILMLMLWAQASLLAFNAARHSPTWDEIAHLAAGMSHWHYGDFSQYAVNPPLVRTVAAAPVYFLLDPVLDFQDMDRVVRKRSEVFLGRRMVANNEDRFLQFYAVARWMCIPFVVLGTLTCFLWARSLFGANAGLFAAGTWAFSPLVLGHGALITPDVAGASVGATAFYCLRAWLIKPDWKRSLLMAFMFAAALLSKSTWLLGLCIVPSVWFIWRIANRAADPLSCKRWLTEFGKLWASLALVLLLFNAFYGFQDSCMRLGDFEFVSTELAGRDVKNRAKDFDNRFADTWMGSIRVPLPGNFVRGVDVQKGDFAKALRGKGWPSYLLGESKLGGWWYYYIVAYMVKEPLPWLLLLLASVPLVLLGKLPGCAKHEVAAFLIPALVVFVMVSAQTSMNRHLRYVLPALPFAIIWTGQYGALLSSKTPKARAILCALMVWSVGSVLYFAPHHLSYFNELAGGPEGGHRVLNSSNVDWGQDLIYLREWMDEYPAEAAGMRVAYFGCFDPLSLGIQYEIPTPYFAPPDKRHSLPYLGPQPGWYAVSTNYMLGSTSPLCNGRGIWIYFGKPVFQYFSEFEPVDRAGYSILIYHLKPDDVQRVRRKLGIPEQAEAAR